MSILDKIMFWKKKDDFVIDNNLNKFGMGSGTGNIGNANLGDFGLDNTGMNMNAQQGYPQYPQSNYQPSSLGFGDAGINTQPQFQQPHASPQFSGYPQNQSPQQNLPNRDMDVVLSKLDALRAVLDGINQRLTNLERMASGDYEQRRRTW